MTSFFEGDDAGAPVSLDDDEELPTFASATVEAVPPSSDASSKDKKPTSRSGATNRIMTLGNMASSSDEDDENTGQVSINKYVQSVFYLLGNAISNFSPQFLAGILRWWIG